MNVTPTGIVRINIQITVVFNFTTYHYMQHEPQ